MGCVKQNGTPTLRATEVRRALSSGNYGIFMFYVNENDYN